MVVTVEFNQCPKARFNDYGRPLTDRSERDLRFSRARRGKSLSPLNLCPGKWEVAVVIKTNAKLAKD